MKKDIEEKLTSTVTGYSTVVSLTKTEIKKTYAECIISDYKDKKIEFQFTLKGINQTVQGVADFLFINDLIIEKFNPTFTNKPIQNIITGARYSFYQDEEENPIEVDEENIITRNYSIILEITG